MQKDENRHPCDTSIIHLTAANRCRWTQLVAAAVHATAHRLYSFFDGGPSTPLLDYNKKEHLLLSLFHRSHLSHASYTSQVQTMLTLQLRMCCMIWSTYCSQYHTTSRVLMLCPSFASRPGPQARTHRTAFHLEVLAVCFLLQLIMLLPASQS